MCGSKQLQMCAVKTFLQYTFIIQEKTTKNRTNTNTGRFVEKIKAKE